MVNTDMDLFWKFTALQYIGNYKLSLQATATTINANIQLHHTRKEEILDRCEIISETGLCAFQVEDAVQALVFLLIRCSQVNTTTTELHTLSTSLGFTEDAAKVLTDTYTDSEAEVKEYLKTLAVKVIFPSLQYLLFSFSLN